MSQSSPSSVWAAYCSDEMMLSEDTVSCMSWWWSDDVDPSEVNIRCLGRRCVSCQWWITHPNHHHFRCNKSKGSVFIAPPTPITSPSFALPGFWVRDNNLHFIYNTQVNKGFGLIECNADSHRCYSPKWHKAPRGVHDSQFSWRSCVHGDQSKWPNNHSFHCKLCVLVGTVYRKDMCGHQAQCEESEQNDVHHVRACFEPPHFYSYVHVAQIRTGRSIIYQQ